MISSNCLLGPPRGSWVFPNDPGSGPGGPCAPAGEGGRAGSDALTGPKTRFSAEARPSQPARPPAPAGAQGPPGPLPGPFCYAPRKLGFRPTFVGPRRNSFEKGHTGGHHEVPGFSIRFTGSPRPHVPSIIPSHHFQATSCRAASNRPRRPAGEVRRSAWLGARHTEGAACARVRGFRGLGFQRFSVLGFLGFKDRQMAPRALVLAGPCWRAQRAGRSVGAALTVLTGRSWQCRFTGALGSYATERCAAKPHGHPKHGGDGGFGGGRQAPPAPPTPTLSYTAT